MRRRRFLKDSMVLSTALMSGCQCITAPPIRPNMQLPYHADSESGAVNTFLAPEAIVKDGGYNNRIVDPHAHIFNASDWQIAGGLRGPFAYTQTGALRELIQSLATPIERCAQAISLSASDEMKKLNTWALLPEAEARQAVIDASDEHDIWLAKALYRELHRSMLADVINQLLPTTPTLFTGTPHTQFSEQFLLDAFAYSLSEEMVMAPRVGSELPDLSLAMGLIIFVYHMLCPRYKNLKFYQRGYTTAGNAIGIDQCYASILDYDYWIGDCEHAVSRLQDQVILMARISQLSNGYMRPLAAYNPWADINNNDDSIRLVVSAVIEYGFAGVKIYPQMGYYPSANSSQPYPPDGEHPDLGLLDEKLRFFFAECRRYDIPVMAHSSDSMGRKISHNKLGGPAAWNTFFADPANAGTRINLAHMGGEEDGPSGTNWTQQFAATMANPNANYLYGDIGIWHKFVNGDAQAKSRLLDILDQPLGNGQNVSDRVMFGTDWLMLSFYGSWRSYTSRFYQLLAAELDPDVMDKIMHRNADTLFKINT